MMNSFNSMRRDFLRVGSLGFAGAAIPAVSFAAQPGAPNAAALNSAIFTVREYGAIGDGKTLDTPAINRAIDAAAAAGGGVILFPAGVYLCFSIHLKSNVHLYLEQGTTILAAESPKPGDATGYNGGTYDAAEPKTAWDAYQDYGHNHWHNSLIWGEDIHDISITGTGLIYGKGLSFGIGPAPAPSTTIRGFFPDSVNILRVNGQSAPSTSGAAPARHFEPRGNYPMYQAEQPGVGNKAIALKNCRNVLLRDFSILKGAHFALLLTGVDNVTIDNLRIDTDRDGVDIDCCQNVRVSNCTVNSPWDDAICPKSSYALGYVRDTRNVTIANCFVSGCYAMGTVFDGTWRKFKPSATFRHGRIKFGTESNGSFNNVTISNCVFEGCAGFALESIDGGLIEDIVIANTTMRDLDLQPMFLRLGARLRGPKDTTKVGALRRILISSLVCHNAPMPISSIFSGIPGHAIEDVKLSNIFVETVGGATPEAAQLQPPEMADSYAEPYMFGQMPASGFFLRHIRNLEMSHVEIANATPDARPAFYLQDVNRADFFSITAPRNADGAFALHDVKDLRIGWSRAAADIELPTIDNKLL